MKRNIFYYKDELNDDFALENIKPIDINSDYKYIHENILWRISSFVIYRLIALPIAFIYSKLIFGLKFENKEVLKKN